MRVYSRDAARLQNLLKSPNLAQHKDRDYRTFRVFEGNSSAIQFEVGCLYGFSRSIEKENLVIVHLSLLPPFLVGDTYGVIYHIIQILSIGGLTLAIETMLDQLELLDAASPCGKGSPLTRIMLQHRPAAYWATIPAPDSALTEQAFPELEPFRVLREAGLLQPTHNQ